MGEYSVNLVGESNYQDAILALSAGDPVKLEHEPTNRFDPNAVRAADLGGRTIGYLERGSWLSDRIISGKTAIYSEVEIVTGGEKGKPSRGVVLLVYTAKDAKARATGQIDTIVKTAHKLALREPGQVGKGITEMGCGLTLFGGVAIIALILLV